MMLPKLMRSLDNEQQQIDGIDDIPQLMRRGGADQNLIETSLFGDGETNDEGLTPEQKYDAYKRIITYNGDDWDCAYVWRIEGNSDYVEGWGARVFLSWAEVELPEDARVGYEEGRKLKTIGRPYLLRRKQYQYELERRNLRS